MQYYFHIKNSTKFHKMPQIRKARKSARQRQFEQVVNNLRSQIAEMEETIKLMPIKGNSKNDCQRINIQHHLNMLDHCVNGIELEDFIPNEYSGDFELSYS